MRVVVLFVCALVLTGCSAGFSAQPSVNGGAHVVPQGGALRTGVSGGAGFQGGLSGDLGPGVDVPCPPGGCQVK